MKYKYIDTHAHVNINAFKDDWEEVCGRALENGVALINVGTQQNTSRRAVEIAESFEEGVYAIVGLHPIHTSASYHDEEELGPEHKGFTSRGEKFDPSFYRELAKSEKVIAIGECGLDYYRQSEKAQKAQEEAFIVQIELANELQKPLMLHVRNTPKTSDVLNNKCPTPSVGHFRRDAYDDVYAILKAHAKVRGNVHFYAGLWEQAKRFFDIGFTISFTGVITFTSDYDELIKDSPLDMLHAETDCPYVTPVPHRGKRNEPLYVKEVYKKIAEIRGEGEEKVQVQLLENAKSLYNI